MEVKNTNKGAKRPSPMTFRATDEQKQEIRDKAGRMPVGAYIRFKVLDMPDPPQMRRRGISSDQEILQEILKELASARLANNLNQIARACNRGQMKVTEETEAAMRQAYQDVRDMRLILLQALGLKAQADEGQPEEEKNLQKDAEDVPPEGGET